MLTSISPVDGRYYRQVSELSSYYSEFALIRYRTRVEIEYFIALCELPIPQLAGMDKALFPRLREIYGNFSEENAARAVEQLRSNIKDVSAEVLPLGSKHMVTAFGSNSREECNTFVRSYRDIYPDLWVYNKK